MSEQQTERLIDAATVALVVVYIGIWLWLQAGWPWWLV